MKVIEDKYIPSLEVRQKVIQEQIGESQRIVFRSMLDVVEGEATSNDQLITSSEYNIRTLCKKIDILEEELKNLK
jgi:hypothetical protein